MEIVYEGLAEGMAPQACFEFAKGFPPRVPGGFGVTRMIRTSGSSFKGLAGDPKP